jgi:plasmid stabilization system protein ParE
VSIRLSRSAEKDVREQLAYLEERSPMAARQFAADLDELLVKLEQGAFEGPEIQLTSSRVVRSWPVPPWRVYYQRRGEELLVVRVYHQARRPITKR